MSSTTLFLSFLFLSLHAPCTSDVKEIKIVGNGPLKEEQHDLIRNAECVIRFNDMKNMREKERSDYMISNLSGREDPLNGIPPNPSSMFLHKTEQILVNVQIYDWSREKVAQWIPEYLHPKFGGILEPVVLSSPLKEELQEIMREARRQSITSLTEEELLDSNSWNSLYARMTVGLVGIIFARTKFPESKIQLYGFNWNGNAVNIWHYWNLEKFAVQNMKHEIVINETASDDYGALQNGSAETVTAETINETVSIKKIHETVTTETINEIVTTEARNDYSTNGAKSDCDSTTLLFLLLSLLIAQLF